MARICDNLVCMLPLIYSTVYNVFSQYVMILIKAEWHTLYVEIWLKFCILSSVWLACALTWVNRYGAYGGQSSGGGYNQPQGQSYSQPPYGGYGQSPDQSSTSYNQGGYNSSYCQSQSGTLLDVTAAHVIVHAVSQCSCALGLPLTILSLCIPGRWIWLSASHPELQSVQSVV